MEEIKKLRQTTKEPKQQAQSGIIDDDRLKRMEKENKKRYDDFVQRLKEKVEELRAERGYLTQQDIRELNGALETYGKTVRMFDEQGWTKEKHPNETYGKPFRPKGYRVSTKVLSCEKIYQVTFGAEKQC